MSNFGSTLFSGSPFIKWTLSPILVLFGVLMPMLIDIQTPMHVAVLLAMEFACFALLAGFWLPPAYAQWAYRFLCGLVFLAYLAYFIDEWLHDERPFKIADLTRRIESRGEASPVNAILGLLIIGVPSFIYAVFGRFSVRREPEELLSEEIDEFDSD